MIKEGDHAIIIDNSGNRLVVKILNKEKYNSHYLPKFRKFKFHKAILDLSQLIGKSYGQFYQVVDLKKGSLQLMEDQKELVKLHFLEQDQDGQAEVEERKDNRNIVDNNKAQKLSEEEISRLKAQGVSGQDIIN